ncbi:polysaccharide deacetylase [Desulfofustis limnaeus]|uniref:Polysaccharide deacetylase n=1 Tax=Desulfofustis limnaeus TaxID=2740163 RepID=A0ABM7W9K1_9BACT|nr:polysaccharide deacetylase [Desulfofustis limnaeus]
MQRLFNLLRLVWAELLYRTGILFVLKAWVLRRRAVVLMYHRVLTPEERNRSFSAEGIVVGVETFTWQMQAAKELFRVVSLPEFLESLRQGTGFSDGTCLITFDDGWSDNYRNAFPVLQRLQIPATIFLPMDFIGSGKMFWREEMAAALWAAAQGRDAESLELLRELAVEQLARMSFPEAKRVIEAYITGLKERPVDYRQEVAERLSAFAARKRSRNHDVDSFIDWEQAKLMRDYGISFGSHSYYHPILTELESDAVAAEAICSRLVLERWFPGDPLVFCYPNGDYDETVSREVATAGYAAAFTTEPGFVAGGDDPLTIKRVNIHEDMTKSRALFLARILGVI